MTAKVISNKKKQIENIKNVIDIKIKKLYDEGYRIPISAVDVVYPPSIHDSLVIYRWLRLKDELKSEPDGDVLLSRFDKLLYYDCLENIVKYVAKKNYKKTKITIKDALRFCNISEGLQTIINKYSGDYTKIEERCIKNEFTVYFDKVVEKLKQRGELKIKKN